MFERLLIVWLTLISAIAASWPSWGPAGVDPFLASKPYLTWLIAATMFSVGCLMRTEEFVHTLKNWPTVLAGTAIQYTAMPLLGYFVPRLLGLSHEFTLGVIIVGCVPGAMASNVITMLARGNVSYSVSLTTCSTMLSPLVVPFTLCYLLQMDLTAGSATELSPGKVSRDLFLTVVLPVLVGFFSCRITPRLEQIARRLAPLVAHVIILWLIAVVVALNRERLGQALDPKLLTVLLLVNLLGYLAGYCGGWLLRYPEDMRRALTIEIGMQNAGLGTTLAIKFFPEYPSTPIPTAMYTFGCVITATLLAQAWAFRDSRRTAPLPPGERGA